MPTKIIRPNENIRLRYRVPRSQIIEFEISAGRPVKSYVVRTRGLELFDQGSARFRYYGGFPDPRREHHQELVLPFDEGEWWLLIVNPSKNLPVEVFYEVSY